MSYGPPPQYQPYQPYQSPPGMPPPGMPPGRRPRRTSRHKAVAAIVFSIGGAFVALLIAGALLGQPKPAHHAAGRSAASQPGVNTQASPAARPKKVVKPKVLAVFTGTGIANTPKFAVQGTWKLEWSYNCASLGSSGNFIVTEDDSVTSAVNVNELGNGGHGVTYGYGDSGRHYLAVNSECAWKVKVVGTR